MSDVSALKTAPSTEKRSPRVLKHLTAKFVYYRLKPIRWMFILYTLLTVTGACLIRGVDILLKSAYPDKYENSVEIATIGIIGALYLALLFIVFVCEAQFNNANMSLMSQNKYELWYTIPFSQARFTVSSIAVTYVSAIYSFIVSYVSIMFILPSGGRLFTHFFNAPFTLMKRFLSEPFKIYPPLDTLDAELLQIEYIKDKFYILLFVLVLLLPLLNCAFQASAVSLEGMLNLRMDRKKSGLIASFIMLGAMVLGGWALYGIEAGHNFAVSTYIKWVYGELGHQPHSILTVAVWELETAVAFVLILCAVLFFGHFYISKRHFNVLT
jgi:hypothetical protein